MTVLSFPPRRPAARTDRDARSGSRARADRWGDERAQLRLLAGLQRSLLEGLLAARPTARAVLRALR